MIFILLKQKSSPTCAYDLKWFLIIGSPYFTIIGLNLDCLLIIFINLDHLRAKLKFWIVIFYSFFIFKFRVSQYIALLAACFLRCRLPGSFSSPQLNKYFVSYLIKETHLLSPMDVISLKTFYRFMVFVFSPVIQSNSRLLQQIN